MEFLFAFAAGALTLINPCVLPLLPVVLGSAQASNRYGPLALTLGLCLSFVAVGLLLATLGQRLGFDETHVQTIAAMLMVAFGLILLVPAFSRGFALATAPLARSADRQIGAITPRGNLGQFLTGSLLGAVWGPCVGPTLGSAIALAYGGETLGRAALIMLAFGIGVSVVMLGLAYGSRGLQRRPSDGLRRAGRRGRWIMGASLLLVGLAILTGALRMAEIWLLDTLPHWLVDFSTIL
ncbi:MAG: cytochrome c biogenesis CcdA family protein [Paracoccaceae bacterium]